MHDLDADGFADMYAQTIAYGLLSARIADPHKKTADDFAGHMRTNPFLRDLMETFLQAGGCQPKTDGSGIDFDELGVAEVVELLDDVNMEAVIHDFGDRNPREDPVIHFYELFLKEYDPKKRTQRGVFYTPLPVVSYIVRSVDTLLRTELGLADGLADTTTWDEMASRHADLKIPKGISPDQNFVQILDPATGTGTFLVEAIDVIHGTLVEKWRKQGRRVSDMEALWNEYVPKHLLPRLHGYELLMAPYAIAHLKISLKLYETGYRFGSEERAQVYLTNALEPAHDFSGLMEFAIPALAHEAQAVNQVKDGQRFTVVIGNPPYSGHSANKGEWIRDLLRGSAGDGRVENYFEVDGGPLNERNPKWLNDDYVKFIRLAHWQIERTGRGVVGFITNHSKYHLVIVPKYRRKVLFGRSRRQVGTILRQLWRQKGVDLLEGHAMPDHIHLVLSIPPKYSVVMVVGYLKGKSAMQIHRRLLGVNRGFTGKHFWSRGYCISTVELDEKTVRAYVRQQDELDYQMELELQ